MRTLIDVRTASDHFPGIGRYAYHLARAIARQKDRGELLLLFNEGLAARFDIAALASEPDVKLLSTKARPFTFREQMLLPGRLRGMTPSVTHFPYIVMPYLAPRPIVVTLHDLIPMHLPHLFTPGRRLLYRASLSLALRASAAVICVSEATLSDLNSAFRLDPARLFVIHEAAAEHFRPVSRNELERVRARHHLPDEYILFLGSNKPHKNIPALIDAFSRLRSAPPLIIAGSEDPRYLQARKRAAQFKAQERTIFLGGVPEEDLPALYSGARAFVFPSLYEGFGLPPLEAMACGTPVACSDIPSLRKTAGDAALLFDPKEPEAIAAALERLLTDAALREDLRERGLRRAAELTWDAAAQRTLHVYRSVSS
jgi:alpha-1,3-rhamnosyl/mannosyltransferase